MNRKEFAALAAAKTIILDGATGTELIRLGMPSGVCPEAWVLEHPDALISVQKAYFEAGSDLVYTCTFGANRLKLQEFGLADACSDMNRRLAALSVQAAAGKGLVFGDLAPTGSFIEPTGELSIDDAIEIFREQVLAQLEAGVDGFAIETMMDVQEARAAAIAVRSCCDLPLLVTMTFDPSGRTLSGNPPVAALTTLQALGIDAFGCNCSCGPAEMAALIASLKPYARVPLIAKPNAGLPEYRDGRTIFPLEAEPFGAHAQALGEAGATLLGGCCGTSPAHIAALARQSAGHAPAPLKADFTCLLSTPRTHLVLGREQRFQIIGERINPTGKKKLQEELLAGKTGMLLQFAAQQEEAGAAILDVNLGMPGIDEAARMRDAVSALIFESGLPLCIDTVNPLAAEAALRLYPGRVLFNSISAEESRLRLLLPIAARYGAALIVLPMTDDGIPETLNGRITAIETVMQAAAAYGYTREDIVVDALIMAVATGANAAGISLGLIEWCRDNQLKCTCGLSNVSFGMPRRDLLNQTFLGMCLGRGLSMAIANPLAREIMDMARAADTLSGKDEDMEKYLEAFA